MTGVCVCGHNHDMHSPSDGICMITNCECRMYKDNDIAEHPPHYAEGRKYEPIDVIEDWDLGFNLGNVVKYVARCDRKGTPIPDLRKAIFYLQHEIARRENAQPQTQTKLPEE